MNGMKFTDLLAMSINNLRRRRLRTFLTVLGVIIGSASIVVMISLGIGLQEKNRELVESAGSITTIQVTEPFENQSGTGKPKHLTDEVAAEFAKIKHVKEVYPILSIPVLMRQGVYEASYVQLNGVPGEYLQNIPLQKQSRGSSAETGRASEDTQRKELKLIYGSEIIKEFSNRKTKRGYYETNELPDVDLVNQPVMVIFDMDGYYESQNDPQKKHPKKYPLEAAGVVDDSVAKSSAYANAVYTDLDQLKVQLKRIFKKQAIPGQPTTKKGKPYPYFAYNTIEVNVDSVKHVKEVQKQLKDTGYQADSNIEWLEQTEEQSKLIQTVLGGIGAVALLVAAIGIANTMMMSIYERTKEIGILKVLGCDLGAIRNMFLLESAGIGFLGGVSGVAVSYLMSFAMNHLMNLETVGITSGGNLSRIPIWLSLMAVVFSVFVGMAAGFFPALRAMSLSPLAAIRND